MFFYLKKTFQKNEKSNHHWSLKTAWNFTWWPFTLMVLFKLRSTCARVLNVFRGILLTVCWSLAPWCLLANYLGDEDSGNNSNDEEHEFEDDDILHNDHEAYELQADCVLDVVQRGSFIALYSPPTSFKLFLCKVLDFGTAAENMVDAYNNPISMGAKYIQCNYLGKIIWEEEQDHLQNPFKNCSFLGTY